MKKIISFVWILVLVFGLIANVANAKLVACVGDSITYGAGISNRNYNSYPAQLGRMLQKFDNQWQTRNFGVSGATLLRNGDLPYVQQSAYNQALVIAYAYLSSIYYNIESSDLKRPGGVIMLVSST